MIVYRMTDNCDPIAAALCQHPKLARLKSGGPWTARLLTGGGVELAQASPTAPGGWPFKHEDLMEERPTHDGLFFRLAKTLPPLSSLVTGDTAGSVKVRLHCGLSVPVMPAYLDGYEITAADTLGNSAREYGRLVERIADFVHETKHLPPALHPDLLALARFALTSCMRLTAETIEAYKLLTTRDVYNLFDAATTAPKTDPAAGGSSSERRESTPAE